MSTTTTTTAAAAATADTAPPKKNNKKLIILIAVAALVLVGGGGGAFMVMKKKAADTEADGDGEGHAPAKVEAKHEAKVAPTFVPLDPFTVNLADRQAERFAQVGVTLEVADAKMADQIKAFMPAIRNNVLLAIADRTAAELLERDGKTMLAEKIRKETSRALGVEMEDEDAAAEDDAHSEKASAKKPVKKKKKKSAPELPVRAVHFSNFIVQ